MPRKRKERCNHDCLNCTREVCVEDDLFLAEIRQFMEEEKERKNDIDFSLIDKEKPMSYQSKYYHAHKKEISEKTKKYRQEHLEEIRARDRERYRQNALRREYIKAYQREHELTEEQKQRKREISKRWYANQPKCCECPFAIKVGMTREDYKDGTLCLASLRMVDSKVKYSPCWCKRKEKKHD